ncbi:hypothetical protein [Leclercia sp. AS011]|uniref:hypothetical protein n=1 Tax=Leclercia sp. AS011 TaxID=3081257 RepID=UPI0030194501
MDSNKEAAQILHISFTKRDGYVWRKRHGKQTLWVGLRTQYKGIALTRATALTVRFIQLKHLALSKDAIQGTLKAYRDQIVDTAFLVSMSHSPLLGTVSQSQNIESDAQIRESEIDEQICSPKHLLSDVLEEWVGDMRTEWKPRTEKLNRKGIELFMEWANKQHIRHVEDVNKQVVADYKEWSMTRYEAPRSRQDALIKLQALFGFCINNVTI